MGCGGGARQGAKFLEIGAQILQNRGVESLFAEESQLGSNRNPVGTQASRDPGGIQSGTKFVQGFDMFLNDCGAKNRKIGARLDPVAKSGLKKMQNWCRLDPDWIPTGSRLGPDWIPTGCMNWEEPALAPIFPFLDPSLPLFSLAAHQPCTNTPPSCTKTAKAVLSQTGVLQEMPAKRRQINLDELDREEGYEERKRQDRGAGGLQREDQKRELASHSQRPAGLPSEGSTL